jgi:enterochelin esterase-like enzyme
MSTAALTPVPLQVASWTSPKPTAHRTTAPPLPSVAPSHNGEGVTYSGDSTGTVHYHFHLPKAVTVSVVPASPVTIDAAHKPLRPAVALQKQLDGAWGGSAAYPVGLHKVLVLVDGRAVLSPHLPVMSESNKVLVNYIDVPPPDAKSCIYAMRPHVERGSVVQDYVNSYITDTVEEIFVYLPASYHKTANATRRYPVLYLLHGDGNQGMGAVQHGKVNIIADNLIADGKMTEMIIVMGSGTIFENGSVNPEVYCRELVEDIIPFVDNRYRTKADRDNRAIAGLSMGSMQASRLSITRPDLFAYAGVFSGFLRTLWSAIGTNDDHMEVLRRDPAAYQNAMKVFFRCIGDEDVHMPRFEEDDAILAELGVECTRRIYKGPHSWHVWRQAAPDFLTMIFK